MRGLILSIALAAAVSAAAADLQPADSAIVTSNPAAVEKPAETPKKTWLQSLHASGSISTEFLVPYNLKGHRTGDKSVYEKDVLNNTYADLSVSAPHVAAGARLQWTKWPLPGYDKDFGGWGVPYFWATGSYKCWQVTAGDFYEQFGSGLILRTYQERTIGVDNALRGGRIKVNPGHGLNITALAGRQRRYWDWNSAWIWGADANWKLDDVFPKAFGRNYGMTVGVSYVGKHDKAEDIAFGDPTTLPGYDPNYNYFLNLPQNIAAFDGRVKFRAHRFDFMAEYATKNNDPNSTNNFTYRRGNAVLLSGAYASKGLSAMLQAKRSENMDFRSKRVIEADYRVSSFINHLPAFTMTQTYALAATYPYSTNADGEWAFQADVRYLWRKGTALGGRYGTTMRLSASYISGLDYNLPAGMTIEDRVPGSDNFGSAFWKIGELYYADLNAEVNKRLSRSFQFTLFYLLQKYNQRIIEGHGVNGDMVTANTFVGEGQWKIARRTTLRFELQYLHTRQDKGDWVACVAELSLAPHWMISVSDNYNTGQRENFYEVLGTYVYKANRFTFGYGKVNDGYNCSGGVCRYVPQTEGFKFSYNYTFRQ